MRCRNGPVWRPHQMRSDNTCKINLIYRQNLKGTIMPSLLIFAFLPAKIMTNKKKRCCETTESSAINLSHKTTSTVLLENEKNKQPPGIIAFYYKLAVRFKSFRRQQHWPPLENKTTTLSKQIRE